MWQTCKETKRKGDRAGGRGWRRRGSRKGQGSDPSSDKTNSQRLDGACTSSHCLFGEDNPRAMRVLREAAFIWTSHPSGLQAQHRLTSSSRLFYSRNPASRSSLWEPAGREGGARGWNTQVKPHYFLITLAEVEREGFHLGSELDVAVTSVWLLHSRPWRTAAQGPTVLPRPGRQ